MLRVRPADAAEFGPQLVASIGALPETLGIPRPYRIERVAEIVPFPSVYYADAAACGFGRVWPMPLKINVIQYACAEAAPLAPLDFVKGFDLVPAMVVMEVDRALKPVRARSATPYPIPWRPSPCGGISLSSPCAARLGVSSLTARVTPRARQHFHADDATRQCVRRRELRLSKYAFGPSSSSQRNAIEEAISKQLTRIRKYHREYGFAFVGDGHAEGAFPMLAHFNQGGFM